MNSQKLFLLCLLFVLQTVKSNYDVSGAKRGMGLDAEAENPENQKSYLAGHASPIIEAFFRIVYRNFKAKVKKYY